jgi:hypothetical protein
MLVVRVHAVDLCRGAKDAASHSSRRRIKRLFIAFVLHRFCRVKDDPADARRFEKANGMSLYLWRRSLIHDLHVLQMSDVRSVGFQYDLAQKPLVRRLKPGANGRRMFASRGGCKRAPYGVKLRLKRDRKHISVLRRQRRRCVVVC